DVAGNLWPNLDSTYDLGTASIRWRTLYADQVIADVVSGPALSGQTWTYPNNMVIDAALGTNTTVSVSNTGAGRADLVVDRNINLGGNIIVTGTVDGVDVGDHAASP